ncbi:MAG: polysaccharide deacetylase family protein [Acidobacteriota bacterium]
MRNVPPGAPLTEQGGRLRGVLDLAAGHYPKFLFGLGVGTLLPVFHFHQATADTLEPAFRYLTENGYRTVVSDDVARLVREGRHPGPRTVMLAFDDAWASLWLVVGPLLEKYDLRVVTYAIPGRLRDATATRPTMADGPVDAAAADLAEDPFVTWPELRALATSGRVDVQSHTWSHSMIFAGKAVTGIVDPEFREPPIIHPRLNSGKTLEFLSPSMLGYPMFARRSRMSDARRFWPDADASARVEATVEAGGGAAFFRRPDWRRELRPLLGNMSGRWETDAERVGEIEQEIAFARDEIQARIGTPVRHMCLPWGITGAVTRSALERLGIVTAFANRLSGRLAVAAGDEPFFLKRLDNRHIFALPGNGRRVFTTFA